MRFKEAIVDIVPPLLVVFLLSVALFFVFFAIKFDAPLAYRLTGIGVVIGGAFIGVLGQLYNSASEKTASANAPLLSFRQKVAIGAFTAIAYGFVLQMVGLLLL